MTMEQCKAHMEDLFGAFSRELRGKTVESWYAELHGYYEIDFARAVRELKGSDRLPTLGEIRRQIQSVARREQYRTDQQADENQESTEPSPFGREALPIVTAIALGKIPYAEGVEQMKQLYRKHGIVPTIALTGDLDEDKETAKNYKRWKWGESLSQLRGLRRVSKDRFEPVKGS